MYADIKVKIPKDKGKVYNAPKKWDMQNRAKPNIME